MKNTLVITIIVAILVGALGFYGGIQYQKSRRGSFGPGQFPNASGRPAGMEGGNGAFQGGRPVSGEITSLDEETMTVKTEDGSSKIIIYSDSTQVNKTSEASKSDLQVGEEVTVIGSESSEGTITAQSISIGSQMFQVAPNEGLPQ